MPQTIRAIGVDSGSVVRILSIVVGAPLFSRYGIEPIYAQCVGVMVGGALQLALQIPALRGLGMMPDRLRELNDRLANTPEINPANTEQLGLF